MLGKAKICIFKFFMGIAESEVAGQYFGICWALLSVSYRDCSYLDLPQNYCFFFTVWVGWEECLPGSAHHKPAKGILIWGPQFWRVEFKVVWTWPWGKQAADSWNCSCTWVVSKKESMGRIRSQTVLVQLHQPLVMDISCREWEGGWHQGPGRSGHLMQDSWVQNSWLQALGHGQNSHLKPASCVWSCCLWTQF